MDGWDHWTTFPLEHRSVSGANKHQNQKFKLTTFMRQGMYFIYIHLSIVLELFNWSSKRQHFTLSLSQIWQIYFIVLRMWAGVQPKGPQMVDQVLKEVPANMIWSFSFWCIIRSNKEILGSENYLRNCWESIKHFSVWSFWHIKDESWIHSLRGDVVEGDSIVAQSTKALVLVVKSLTIKHQRWM